VLVGAIRRMELALIKQHARMAFTVRSVKNGARPTVETANVTEAQENASVHTGTRAIRAGVLLLRFAQCVKMTAPARNV